MSVNAGLYVPPFCTQRGIDSTLDDCSIVATIHALATATSGEIVTRPDGREMGKPMLQAMARQMRVSLGPSADTGGLSISQRQQMCREAGYPAPDSIDIAFRQLLANLKTRKAVYSVSGNPGSIKGASPLKRTNVAHEWYVHAARGPKAAWDQWDMRRIEVRIYDGMRPAGPAQRGEWRPAIELRQMAFKDSDSHLLDFVLAYPPGGWTAEKQTRRQMRARLDAKDAKMAKLTSDLNKLQKQLAACQAGTQPDLAAVKRDARTAMQSEALAAVAGLKP